MASNLQPQVRQKEIMTTKGRQLTSQDPNRCPEVRTELTTATKSRQLTSQGPTYKLLNKVNVVKEFKFLNSINHICPTADGHAWVIHEIKTLILIDSTGQTKHTLKHHTDISDISVAADTTLWFCCYNNRTINEVPPSSTRAVTRFTIDDNPSCLCVTGDRRVVVGTGSRVTVYTPGGAVLHTTTRGESGVGYPLDITHCPVTGNIAVGSYNISLVFDSTLTVRYRYRGEGIVQGGEAVTPDTYRQGSMVYDSVGNLVIVETKRNTIELISGAGKHIKTLLTSTGVAGSIAIQTGDVLWVKLRLDTGEWRVQLIKYYTD